MIHDAEAVVNAYLAETLSVDRIGTSTPADLSELWIRTTLINGTGEAKSTPTHLVPCHLQFDCYAGSGRNTRAVASDLARELWASLEQMCGEHGGAVISGAVLIGIKPLRDDSIEPARERFIVEATVYMH